MHGQGELHATGTATHHGHAGFALVMGESVQQLLPPVIELVNGFDRHGVFGGAADGAHLWRRADIDGNQIVRHRRAVAAQNGLLVAVEPDRFVPKEPGTRVFRQPPQIDMHVVITVMPGDIARQHAGVGGVGIPADHRQPHPGLGLHGKPFKHTHMAVASADQNNIAQDGLFGVMHETGLSLMKQNQN